MPEPAETSVPGTSPNNRASCSLSMRPLYAADSGNPKLMSVRFRVSWLAFPMRILVTGARGKVGAATVDRLLQDGHEVTAVDIAPAVYARDLPEQCDGDVPHDRGLGTLRPPAVRAPLERDRARVLLPEAVLPRGLCAHRRGAPDPATGLVRAVQAFR